jgi:crotonobetainyl-CoA:carnitine CoA-transferase CaiB-like acyl-CoA transferase
MARTVIHSAGDAIPMVANPILMSETPINQCAPPPLLGEHSDEVLMGLLCYDCGKVEALR